MNGRERILGLLENRPVDSVPCMPITMQFAARLAGVPYRRYAFDYRALAAAQVQVAETFDFDHVSVISDPAREASDLGASIVAAEDAPPAMDGAHPLLDDRKALMSIADRADVCGPRMSDRLAAVEALKTSISGSKLIEGWIEGPCAEAADLRGMNNLMTDFSDDPAFVQDLFEFVTALEIGFARRQVAAGADIIGIGDAAASLVGPRLYGALALPYERRMVEAIHGFGALVRLHICGNTSRILGAMATTGADIIDLDYPSSVARARAEMGPQQALLGNIDPVRVLQDLDPVEVYAAIEACHGDAGERYIVGAGCEAPVATPEANMRALVRYAREHKPSGEKRDGGSAMPDGRSDARG